MFLESIKKFIEEAQKKALEKQEKYNNFINSIDDEIVKKTSFLPLKGGGTSYKTHSLITDINGNIIFKVNKWFPTMFVGIFSLPFIGTIFSITYYITNNYNNLDINELKSYTIPLIAFALFCFPIALLFYNIFKSKIFDFVNGYFYDFRYQNKLYSILNEEKYKNKIIPISQIHAIQIIKERVSTKNSSYNSYEFNLILKDSSRINVIDHGNLEKLKNDVQEVANRLGVRIWDLSFID